MKGLNKLTGMAVVAAMLSVAGCKKDTTMSVIQAKQNSALHAQMVLFPRAGWVPADQVHYIEPGNYLTHYGGHILKLEKGTDKLIQDFGEFKQAQTASVQTSAANPSVNLTNSLNSKSGGNIPAAVGANWVTWSQWTPTPSTSTINSFNTTWTVPHNPTITTDGQTIFIFNALTDATGSDILQPVLQWGSNSSSGGGNYWSIVNVYVAPPLTIGAPGFYAYTSAVEVYPGNSLTGVMTFNSEGSDGSYIYNSAFTGYSNSLLLEENVTPRGANVFFKNSYAYAPFIPQLNVADEAIEAYTGMGGPPSTIAADYPPDDSVAMTSISITLSSSPSTLNWSTGNISNTIGQRTTVPSNANPNGIVDLWFHNPIQKPIISYATPQVWPDGILSSVSPTNTGGVPVSYAITPTPPSWLSFSTSTGVLSATPSVVSGPTTYTITATNSGGTSSPATVTISTVQDVLFTVTNTSAESLTITFKNLTTGAQTSNSSSAGSGRISPFVSIPPGSYNITISPSGVPQNCNMILNTGQATYDAPGTVFSNITVSSTQTNSLNITTP